MENKPVKILFQNGSKTIEQTLPWDADLNDYLYAIYTSLIGIEFHPKDILEGMKEFSEYYDDVVDITNE